MQQKAVISNSFKLIIKAINHAEKNPIVIYKSFQVLTKLSMQLLQIINTIFQVYLCLCSMYTSKCQARQM